jgi:hypothetical protein
LHGSELVVRGGWIQKSNEASQAVEEGRADQAPHSQNFRTQHGRAHDRSITSAAYSLKKTQLLNTGKEMMCEEILRVKILFDSNFLDFVRYSVQVSAQPERTKWPYNTRAADANTTAQINFSLVSDFQPGSSLGL